MHWISWSKISYGESEGAQRKFSPPVKSNPKLSNYEFFRDGELVDHDRPLVGCEATAVTVHIGLEECPADTVQVRDRKTVCQVWCPATLQRAIEVLESIGKVFAKCTWVALAAFELVLELASPVAYVLYEAK